MTPTSRPNRVYASVATVVTAATFLVACGPGSAGPISAPPVGNHGGHGTETSAPAERPTRSDLRAGMRELWSDHMQWTYATVDSFFHNPSAVQPTLDRLLRNQSDIGNAIKPFYGTKAGDALTALLTAHINGAVPVLQAAQSGDQAALKSALDAWYANAKEIADFLSAANPKHWPTSATEPMMKGHIDQTTAYATELLKGDHASAIEHYDEAYDHMMMLADTLAQGVAAQFPNKVRR